MSKPIIGFTPVNMVHERGRARWDGQPMRKPKKGELYLSGATPAAYRAPCDLGSEYFIAEPCTAGGRGKEDRTT